MVHVVAAAFGVSALIASSATAFTIVKYAGAAYLILLGIRKLLARDAEEPDPEPRDPVTMRRLFWQGAVVNILNPKTALFFLAFLPQFVDPSAPVAPQMLVLGTMLVGLGVLSDGTYALVAAGAGPQAARDRRGAAAAGPPQRRRLRLARAGRGAGGRAAPASSVTRRAATPRRSYAAAAASPSRRPSTSATTPTASAASAATVHDEDDDRPSREDLKPQGSQLFKPDLPRFLKMKRER